MKNAGVEFVKRQSFLNEFEKIQRGIPARIAALRRDYTYEIRVWQGTA